MGNQHQDRRGQVLSFVRSYADHNGYPPTYEEIMDSVPLSSKSHVVYYLRSLEAAGLITRKRRSPRSISLPGAQVPTFAVKVEGHIAAGQPIDLMQSLAREIELTADIADPRRDLYALQVQGDSMVDDLVGDGDVIIVERKQEVARGQMAVVYLRDRNQSTLKRVFPEGEKVRLQPSHPTQKPFFVDAAQVQIQGRVVAVIRRL